MKINRLIKNYIYEKDFTINYKKNKINIINYDELLDFSSTLVKVSSGNKIFLVEGNNLTVIKMMDSELLIEGRIEHITIN